jgi:hypothetical protein
MLNDVFLLFCGIISYEKLVQHGARRLMSTTAVRVSDHFELFQYRPATPTLARRHE